MKGDSVLNIFLVEDWASPYDAGTCNFNSLPLAGRGYTYPNCQAYCNSNSTPSAMWVVISNLWAFHLKNNAQPWQFASLTNHELCHTLGLNHPFQGLSTCDDAPMHPNANPAGGNYPTCWNLDPGNPNCNSWELVSNNLMDYSASQIALSPCQIGIVQYNLNSCLRSRYVYRCSECMATDAAFELVMRTTGPRQGLWLDGRAAYHVHSFKIEIDRLQQGLPLPQYHYEYTTQREVRMEYLQPVYNFQLNKTYRITLRTYTNCGSTAVRVRTFSPEPVSTPADPLPKPYTRIGHEN